MELNKKSIDLKEFGVEELEKTELEQTNGGLSLSLGGPISLGGVIMLPLNLGFLNLGTNLGLDLNV
ncbi:hypothetical protein IFO69_14135 [Echinicola sp. CAU 1574]|uniref:Bacteriocin n=1 Tax=Echinicola arenosa TaxID=2774144 RepID=A0ABR9AM70_9BACT|nr:hypothetical protein [Echinicola arenosa]MBD8489893.1 hypothetical protein [Echinicola arenosa]